MTRRAGALIHEDWHLTPEGLQFDARHVNLGAPCPDGWATEELSHWPIAAWEQFLQLWHVWCEDNAFPNAWQHSKQVMIPKNTVTASSVLVKDLRPVTVQPVICRIISSQIAKTATRWIEAQTTISTHGGLRKRSLEGAMMALDHGFEQGSILVSLDMEKCFDFVQPEIAIAHLEHAGFHPQWAAHLHHMWTSQHRWIQLGDQYSDQPQRVKTSLPQGCAMAPIALITLLVAATRTLEDTYGSEYTIFSNYIDDRAFATNDPDVAFELITEWQKWCCRLGLKESQAKMKIICKNPVQARRMIELGVPPATFVDNLCILGVDFWKGNDAKKLVPASREMNPLRKSCHVLKSCLSDVISNVDCFAVLALSSAPGENGSSFPIMHPVKNGSPRSKPSLDA